MKQIIVLIALFFSPAIGSADIILNTGESFQFDFTIDDFTYQYDMPPPLSDPAPVQFGYSVSIVSSTPLNLRLSLFRDDSATPFMVSTNSHFTLPPIPGFYSEPYAVILDADPSNYWPNGIGAIKLEALDRSVRIDSMVAGAVIDDKYYQAVAAIPEPSSVALILLGSGCLYLRKKKDSQPAHGPYAVKRTVFMPNA